MEEHSALTAQNENWDCDMATLREITRQELKDLIDCVPTDELIVVKRYIQYVIDMQDPLLKTLAEAPVDGEPLDNSDLVALKEAWEDVAAGNLISNEALKERLGI